MAVKGGEFTPQREVDSERLNDASVISQVPTKAVFATKEHFHVNAGTGGNLNGMMKSHPWKMTSLT